MQERKNLNCSNDTKNEQNHRKHNKKRWNKGSKHNTDTSVDTYNKDRFVDIDFIDSLFVPIEPQQKSEIEQRNQGIILNKSTQTNPYSINSTSSLQVSKNHGTKHDNQFEETENKLQVLQNTDTLSNTHNIASENSVNINNKNKHVVSNKISKNNHEQSQSRAQISKTKKTKSKNSLESEIIQSSKHEQIHKSPRIISSESIATQKAEEMPEQLSEQLSEPCVVKSDNKPKGSVHKKSKRPIVLDIKVPNYAIKHSNIIKSEVENLSQNNDSVQKYTDTNSKVCVSSDTIKSTMNEQNLSANISSVFPNPSKHDVTSTSSGNEHTNISKHNRIGDPVINKSAFPSVEKSSYEQNNTHDAVQPSKNNMNVSNEFLTINTSPLYESNINVAKHTLSSDSAPFIPNNSFSSDSDPLIAEPFSQNQNPIHASMISTSSPINAYNRQQVRHPQYSIGIPASYPSTQPILMSSPQNNSYVIQNPQYMQMGQTLSYSNGRYYPIAYSPPLYSPTILVPAPYVTTYDPRHSYPQSQLPLQNSYSQISQHNNPSYQQGSRRM